MHRLLGLRRVLVGDDVRRTVSLVGVALVLGTVTFVANAPTRYVGPSSVDVGFVLPVFWALLCLVAAVGAYHGGGLLACIVIAVSPAAGFYLALYVYEVTLPVAPFVWSLRIGLAVAVVIGVVGYVLGASARRLVKYGPTGVS
ncbi:MAG: hypothetical protein ACQETI_01395 [Halobacteriota archaeon]